MKILFLTFEVIDDLFYFDSHTFSLYYSPFCVHYTMNSYKIKLNHTLFYKYRLRVDVISRMYNHFWSLE